MFSNYTFNHTQTGATPETFVLNTVDIMPYGGYIQGMNISGNVTSVTCESAGVKFIDLMAVKGLFESQPSRTNAIAVAANNPLTLEFISTGSTSQTYSIIISYLALPAETILSTTSAVNIAGTSGIIFTNSASVPVMVKSIFVYSDSNASTSMSLEFSNISSTISLTDADWNLSLTKSFPLKDIGNLILKQNDTLTLLIPGSTATVGVLFSGNLVE